MLDFGIRCLDEEVISFNIARTTSIFHTFKCLFTGLGREKSTGHFLLNGTINIFVFLSIDFTQAQFNRGFQVLGKHFDITHRSRSITH
ncbi:hypothetical protein BH688_05735 [Kushneria phosphatilytica]|nr:hypothetical protein BH688_05735 [Kushneria phosphatilytica]